MNRTKITKTLTGQNPFCHPEPTTRHPELVSGSIPVADYNNRETIPTGQTSIDRSQSTRQTGSHNSQARWFALSTKFGMTQSETRLPSRHPELVSGSIPVKAHHYRKAAFTLAEVLITLGIIGIVAAMTMPTLITKYQKKQTVIQLKKAYSEISQAVQLAQVEHGLMETWDFANYPNALSRGTDFFENYLMKNMKVIKKCIPSNSECWADDIYTLNKVITTNANLQNSSGTKVSFVTASGYSIYGWLHGTGTGGWFFVDLNGPKAKPNQIGRDIFAFVIQFRKGYFAAGLQYAGNITREDLISNPNGLISETEYLCEKGKNHSLAGTYCTGVIAIDGWEIKDDYPW